MPRRGYLREEEEFLHEDDNQHCDSMKQWKNILIKYYVTRDINTTSVSV
jgi:hypothetical protein